VTEATNEVMHEASESSSEEEVGDEGGDYPRVA
jgi:hypothetical protein